MSLFSSLLHLLAWQRIHNLVKVVTTYTKEASLAAKVQFVSIAKCSPEIAPLRKYRKEEETQNEDYTYIHPQREKISGELSQSKHVLFSLFFQTMFCEQKPYLAYFQRILTSFHYTRKCRSMPLPETLPRNATKSICTHLSHFAKILLTSLVVYHCRYLREY